ncbi:MAG: hypothetical protein R3E79_25715 [Caldilineaceae bacterium]
MAKIDAANAATKAEWEEGMPPVPTSAACQSHLRHLSAKSRDFTPAPNTRPACH